MSEITVMTYNICHYDKLTRTFGFPENIYEEKYWNFKELLMEFAPDFVGIQEEYQFLDAAHTRNAASALYGSIWSFHSGAEACTIRSKYPCISGTYERPAFSTGSTWRRGMFTVDKKKLLFISVHPIARATAERRAMREKEYNELFNYIKSAKWDYCIVTGDFNTTYKADKTQLQTLCKENGFSMAIGGCLPWVNTFLGATGTEKPHSFDNILTSKNITIKKVKVLRDWYDRLYSDHVPVVADLILK